MVSASPVWVKIGDFGLAKLMRNGTAFRTPEFSPGYSPLEIGIKTSGDSSEYTNAVDIWAVGCIAHEMLTRLLPFPNISELSLYCISPRNSMLLKNISRKGMEIVESMLAINPDRRIAAKEALNSEWLRPEEDMAGSALPGAPAPSEAEVVDGDLPQGNSKGGFRDRVPITVDVKNRNTTTGVLLLELKHRLQVGFLSN